jgi:hypothetical protein
VPTRPVSRRADGSRAPRRAGPRRSATGRDARAQAAQSRWQSRCRHDVARRHFRRIRAALTHRSAQSGPWRAERPAGRLAAPRACASVVAVAQAERSSLLRVAAVLASSACLRHRSDALVLGATAAMAHGGGARAESGDVSGEKRAPRAVRAYDAFRARQTRIHVTIGLRAGTARSTSPRLQMRARPRQTRRAAKRRQRRLDTT